MADTKSPTMNEVLEHFAEELRKAIESTGAKFKGRIIRGYKSSKFKNRLMDIRRRIDGANSLLPKYLTLLDRTIKGDINQVLTELSQLSALNKSDMDYSLKEYYVNFRKVEIPSFPNFKKSFLIQAYDFPEYHIELINQIKSDLQSFEIGLDLADHYNTKNNRFEFTEAAEKELLEEFTVYASSDQVAEVMSLYMLCQGINNLKTDNEWSFKELPEIDHRIMSKVTVSRERDKGWNPFLPGKEYLAVDIDRINNGETGNAMVGINQKPYGGMSIKVVSSASEEGGSNV